MACYQHGRDKTPRPNNQLFVIDLRAITHMGVYTVPGRGSRGGNSHTSWLAPFDQSNVYKMLLGQAISGPNPPMTWLRWRLAPAACAVNMKLVILQATLFTQGPPLPTPPLLSPLSRISYCLLFLLPSLFLFTLACFWPQFDLSLQSLPGQLESLLNTCPRV